MSVGVPLVSVIMPLYNHGPHVCRAIDSLRAQIAGDWELVVVDDGSTDGGGERVASYGDPRIRLFRQENAGAAAAQNHAIAQARGQWVAFLDPDDEYLPRKLQLHEELAQRRPALAWHAAAYEVFVGQRRLETAPAASAGQPVVDDAIDALAACGRTGTIWTSGVCIRRSALEAVGPFQVDLRAGYDTNMWIRLALRFPSLGYIAEPVARYHAWLPGSLTAESFRVNDLSTIRWAEKALALSESLASDDPRRQTLRRYSRNRLIDRARLAALAAEPRHGREMLAQLGRLQLGNAPLALRAATRIPRPLLRAARSTFVLGRRLMGR